MPVNDYEGCDTQNWQGSAWERMRNPASSSQQKLDARDMDRAYDDGLSRPETEAPLQRPGGRLRESKDREQDFAYSGNDSDIFKGRGERMGWLTAVRVGSVALCRDTGQKHIDTWSPVLGCGATINTTLHSSKVLLS